MKTFLQMFCATLLAGLILLYLVYRDRDEERQATRWVERTHRIMERMEQADRLMAQEPQWRARFITEVELAEMNLRFIPSHVEPSDVTALKNEINQAKVSLNGDQPMPK